jgi:DNA-nicking Smr family endonuclease
MVKIDLHGVRHADVRRVLIRFIEDHMYTADEGEVIYGYSTSMPALVREVADEYKLTYREGKFAEPAPTRTLLFFK